MYSLNTSINPDNAFLLKRSEIEGRIDPKFNSASQFAILNKILNSKYKVVNFREIIKEFKGGPMGFHLHTYDYRESGIPVLRIGNLKNLYLNKEDSFIYISSEKHKELINSNIKPGDIIFSKAGKVGEMSIVPNGFGEGNLNQALSRIRLKKNINTEYVFLYFKSNLGGMQIQRYGTGKAVQDDLKMSEITNFKIILPPLETQQKIVVQYQKAYNIKLQKERAAKEILENIDIYLLNELGITLPEKDNSLENRVFEVNWSELFGDRFDAFSFFNNSLKIEGGIFPNHKLQTLANVKKGQSITSANVIEGIYPVIAGGKSSPFSHNVYNNEGNTITVSASGAYSGYVWYHKEKIFASDCAVVKSKEESLISMDYLSEILKLKQKEIYGLQQGAGQPHVYPSDLVKLNIPLPLLETQNRITKHIFELRAKAKKLELEAEQVLKVAKNKIEKIIL